MTVTLDDKLLSPADGFLIRKGPGNCYFDFAQQIIFAGSQRGGLAQPASLGGRQRPTPAHSTYD